MDVPGIDVITARSPLLAQKFPSGSEEALTALVSEAATVVAMLTGRVIGITGDGPFGCPLEEVPPALVPLATRLVRLRAEKMDLLEGDAAALIARAQRTLGGLASFTAGPYSESYFAPGQTITTLKALDPDPEMAAELWALATECVRDGWMRTWDPMLPHPGYSFVEETDWMPNEAGYIYPQF